MATTIDPALLEVIQTEAKKAAQDVFDTKGTQYGVADTPVHIHNGVDLPILPASSVDAFLPLPATSGGVASPILLGSEIINDFKQASNIQQAAQTNTATIYVNPIPTIYGLSDGTETMTGTPLTGATSATLTAAWPYDTVTQKTVFANPNFDQRSVTYTKGSTAISWSAGLSGDTTGSGLTLYGSPSHFVGGEAPAGTVIIFSNIAAATFSDLNVALWVRVNTVPDFTQGNYTATGSLSVGATSFTLSSAWTGLSGVYFIKFSSKEVYSGTFTNGSTAVSIGGTLTASATSTITVTSGAWFQFASTDAIPNFT